MAFLRKDSMELEAQIHQLPHEPGVYLFKNAGGEVIYIGKALDLNKLGLLPYEVDKLRDL